MTRFLICASFVLLLATAHADLFDGMFGEELPPPGYTGICFCSCPPQPDSDYTLCYNWVRLDGGFKCLTQCRYHDTDAWPELPGGWAAWTTQFSSTCAATAGANFRDAIYVTTYPSGRYRIHQVPDGGCWTQ